MAVGQEVLAPVSGLGVTAALEEAIGAGEKVRSAAHVAQLRQFLELHAVNSAAGFEMTTPAQLALVLSCSEWRAVDGHQHPPGQSGPCSTRPRLRRFLRLRAPRCEWPGCGARATRCDLDHDQAWPAGAARRLMVSSRDTVRAVTADGVLLETERLVLRRFTADDVDLLVELDADPAVVHHVTGGAPTAREEVETEWLPAFLAAYERGDGYGFWAAEEKPSRAFVGWFHLRPAGGAPRDEPELGYRLARRAWGRGLASEGATALVDHAFTELGARRVVAQCMAVHTASRRVMEKAGLRLVRTFHQDWPVRIPGDEQGDVEYAVSRQEWTAR